MRLLFGVIYVTVAVWIVADSQLSLASQKDSPKYTISDVMKKGHAGKTSLLTKVCAGKATAAESKELLEMYEALAKNTPPQGDAASWKKRCDALVDAAKQVVDGKKDDALVKLNEATNCNSCHKEHKG